MMREYRSFDEIERDVKLLKLQQEVDKERVILSYNLTKESISPKNMLKSLGQELLKVGFIYKGTSKVLEFVGNRW